MKAFSHSWCAVALLFPAVGCGRESGRAGFSSELLRVDEGGQAWLDGMALGPVEEEAFLRALRPVAAAMPVARLWPGAQSGPSFPDDYLRIVVDPGASFGSVFAVFKRLSGGELGIWKLAIEAEGAGAELLVYMPRPIKAAIDVAAGPAWTLAVVVGESGVPRYALGDWSPEAEGFDALVLAGSAAALRERLVTATGELATAHEEARHSMVAGPDVSAGLVFEAMRECANEDNEWNLGLLEAGG